MKILKYILEDNRNLVWGFIVIFLMLPLCGMQEQKQPTFYQFHDLPREMQARILWFGLPNIALRRTADASDVPKEEIKIIDSTHQKYQEIFDTFKAELDASLIETFSLCDVYVLWPQEVIAYVEKNGYNCIEKQSMRESYIQSRHTLVIPTEKFHLIYKPTLFFSIDDSYLLLNRGNNLYILKRDDEKKQWKREMQLDFKISPITKRSLDNLSLEKVYDLEYFSIQIHDTKFFTVKCADTQATFFLEFPEPISVDVLQTLRNARICKKLEPNSYS